MQAISIDTNKKSIDIIDIKMQANTIYTFFSSILIDEITSLNSHIIYTDSNALEENKTPYFLGDQLLLGNALITGKSREGDIEASVPIDILEELISYEVPGFYHDVFKILSLTDVNIYRLFTLTKDSQKVEVNIEWVLATFNIADAKTQQYFLDSLEKSLEEKNTQETIKKLAQLALNVA